MIAIEMMAKIQQLAEQNLIDFDGLVVLEARPLLSPSDSVGRWASKVLGRELSLPIVERPSPDVNYAKTITYMGSGWAAFLPGTKRISSDIVSDIDRNDKCGVTIFVSYDLEKRKFLNQSELLADAIGILKDRYKNLTILVNGMTGPDGGAGDDFLRDIHEVERGITASILAVNTGVEAIDMFGWSLRDKLRAVAKADFFIAPRGNASFIPASLDIVGVSYLSPQAMGNVGGFSRLSRKTVFVDKNFVIPHEQDHAMRKVGFGHNDGTRVSYSIDREGFLETIRQAMAFM